jgi:hypothetical protein
VFVGWLPRRLGRWADHVTRWTFDGRPALLLAQPYSINNDHLITLGALTMRDDLDVRVGNHGWLVRLPHHRGRRLAGQRLPERHTPRHGFQRPRNGHRPRRIARPDLGRVTATYPV